MKTKFATILLLCVGWTGFGSPAAGQVPPPDLAKDARAFQKGLDNASDAFIDIDKTARKIRGKSASAVLDWVTRNISFEPYSGELRGARGVLRDKRGNSVDQAELVVALMRAKGINARYARGRKSPERIQALLTKFAGNATLIDPASISNQAASVQDPTVNPRYTSLIDDHVWAEVESNGVWLAADPVFASKLAPPVVQATSRESEMWDDLRAKISIEIQATLSDGQQKQVASWTGRVNETEDGLRLTFNPHTRVQNALIPVFQVGDSATTGDYFPADGVTKMVAKVRIRRGMIESRFEEVLANKNERMPVFSFDQAYFAFSFFNTFGTPEFARYQATKALNAAADAMQGWVASSSALGEKIETIDARPYLNQIHAKLPHSIATSYITHYDALIDELAFGLGIKQMLLEPRFVTTALLRKGAAYTLRISVRDPGLDAMPRKGVPEAAAAGFLTMAGRIEAQLQGELLGGVTGDDLITVDDVFMAAEKAGVPLTTIDAKSISRLSKVQGDTSAIRDLIRRRGTVILTPTRSIDMDGAAISGFWSLNPETGQLSGHMLGGLVSALKTDAEAAKKQPGNAAFSLMKRMLVLADTTEDTNAHVGVVCAARKDLAKLSTAFCATSEPLKLPSTSQCLNDDTTTDAEILSLRPCEVRTQTSRCGTVVSSALLTGELTALYAADGEPVIGKKSKTPTRAFGLTCR